ncbi:MAG: serine hydrolase domain-containing protein, partial [bacterium]
MRVAFAAVLAAGCAAAPVSGELSSLPERKLTDVLTSAYAEFGFPGAIAGVWSPAGEWVGTVGTATAGAEEPLTPGHHTRIGSITKTFTVTLLLQEVSRGSLALDDTIGKFVSGLPNGERATLRDLAQMTSGIPSYTAQESFLSDHFDDVDRAFTAR